MVRVHFGPPLLNKVKKKLRPGQLSSEGEHAKMDSKGGSWQQSGGLLQPPWLFRRKASPWPTTSKRIWGFSSAGRAPALQAGGQRFDPANLHHILKEIDWSSNWKVEASLNFLKRFNCTLKTEHCELWCNYEKATVKDRLFFRVKYNFC